MRPHAECGSLLNAEPCDWFATVAFLREKYLTTKLPAGSGLRCAARLTARAGPLLERRFDQRFLTKSRFAHRHNGHDYLQAVMVCHRRWTTLAGVGTIILIYSQVLMLMIDPRRGIRRMGLADIARTRGEGWIMAAAGIVGYYCFS